MLIAIMVNAFCATCIFFTNDVVLDRDQRRNLVHCISANIFYLALLFMWRMAMAKWNMQKKDEWKVNQIE